MTRCYQAAANVRRRLITRPDRLPAVLRPSVIADIWPPAGARVWWPARATWNLLRWTMAHLWAERWTGWRHPHLQRLGRTLWTLVALVALTTALTLVLALALVWPLWWLTARAIGTGLVLAGWSPPLTANDITPPETADLYEPPVEPAGQSPAPPPGPASTGADPWDRNHGHDPHLALQAEAVAELRRSNDLTAQQLHPAPHHHRPPPPAPTVAPPWPPQPTPAQYLPHRRQGQGPWSAVKALLWVSIAMGSVFTILAWGLAWLSALGVIDPPPTLHQPATTVPAAVETTTTGGGEP